MVTAFLEEPPPTLAKKPLSEEDAVAIWIARWLKIRPSVLVKRYGCDPRRLYEIWEETRFPGSRKRALIELQARFPGLNERIDPGPHRRVPLAIHPDQLSLFPEA